MNDRFKFRFFNEYSNKLESCDEYDLKDIFESGNPVMQCTGLKDKNSKLIYEGDIVEDALMNRFTITFNEEYLSYLLTNIKTNEQMVFYPNIKLEVIGNIHENKELLESEG